MFKMFESINDFWVYVKNIIIQRIARLFKFIYTCIASHFHTKIITAGSYLSSITDIVTKYRRNDNMLSVHSIEETEE